MSIPMNYRVTCLSPTLVGDGQPSSAMAAKFSLARSFGLAPANRGVKSRGAYAFLRHPMYLGYVVEWIGLPKRRVTCVSR